MKRPDKIVGHVSPWVKYADELEAEIARLKVRLESEEAHYCRLVVQGREVTITEKCPEPPQPPPLPVS